MAAYTAVNLDSNSGDMAPVIYSVDEHGYLNGVYMSWQRPDGSSASGNIDADVDACRSELAKLLSCGHDV